MNRQQQIECTEQIEEYLQKNNIHTIFTQLIQQIALQKPKNLIDFVIQQLQTPDKCTLFVVGPPGLSINTIIPKAAIDGHRNWELFNFGQEVSAYEKLLSQQEKTKLKSCRLINCLSVKGIVDKVQKIAKSDKSYIIEGFPKNLEQALLLQQRGIYAKNVLIVNVHYQGLLQLCTAKIQAQNPDLDMHTRSNLVREAVLQHEINIRQIKNFYKEYKQIDISRNKSEDFIIHELKKAFNLQIIQSAPRNLSQIIIVGAPFSGRTTLGKKIADHYHMIYISTSALIAEEIRRDTIHGRKVKQAFLNNELIDNFLIEKLIEERITKKDCRMQGFVLEGYPKTKEQFENIRNMKLEPTMIIAVDTPKEVSQMRSQSSPQKHEQRYQKWKQIEAFLKESKERIFWIDPLLSISGMKEQVIHELEKEFI